MAPLSHQSAAHSQPMRRQRRRSRFSRRGVVPWLFVLPVLLLHGLVIVGPSITGLYYSLTKWSGIGPAEFIGLENFRRLIFDDLDFRRAFLNNLIWLAIFLTVPIALSLVAASLLAPIRRGSMFFRAVLFIPYIVPSVVTASIWRNLLHPTLGIGGQLAKAGVPGLDIAYLGNSRTALFAVAFADNWHWWGFLMVLFLAAMQNIPPDLYEAARIDGANRWDEFRHITIPGIRPTLVFMILMTAIWSFLVFDYIWILTQGGPAGSSEVLGTLLFKNAFNRFDAGYASAMGLTMSFFAGIIICIFIVLRRRGWEI
jgi:raffinose/stachyose/melibiose transport system permease protein